MAKIAALISVAIAAFWGQSTGQYIPLGIIMMLLIVFEFGEMRDRIERLEMRMDEIEERVPDPSFQFDDFNA